MPFIRLIHDNNTVYINTNHIVFMTEQDDGAKLALRLSDNTYVCYTTEIPGVNAIGSLWQCQGINVRE